MGINFRSSAAVVMNCALLLIEQLVTEWGNNSPSGFYLAELSRSVCCWVYGPGGGSQEDEFLLLLCGVFVVQIYSFTHSVWFWNRVK